MRLETEGEKEAVRQAEWEGCLNQPAIYLNPVEAAGLSVHVNLLL